MEDGVDPNITDPFENSPIHYACLEGHKAVVKTILRFGGDINIQNKSGNTPLHVSFAYGRDAIIDYLLEKDANVDLHHRIAMQRKNDMNTKINHWVKQATMADPE